jgi:hypothetical protein
MAINREQLFAAIAPAVITKPVEGVGDLAIRQVSEADFSAISESAQAGGEAFLARLAVAALVDDAGSPLLTPDDLPALRAGAFGPVQHILKAVAEVNKLGGPEKNSEATPVADSSTA